MIIEPAITMDSLEASAMFFPALTAANVGMRPAEPTIAETTISACQRVATSMSPFSPARISTGRFFFFNSPAADSSETATTSGLKVFIWDSSKLMLFFAAIPITLNLPGNCLTTSRVVLPIEPVEPNMQIFFTNTSKEDKELVLQ